MRNLKGFYIGLSVYTFIIMLSIKNFNDTILFIFGIWGTWLMYLAFSNDLIKEKKNV